jgi:hypothetical protein
MPATWTCARCGTSVPVAVPTQVPANCPSCNYPDPPPEGYVGRQDDLEADISEDQRRIAEAAAPDVPTPFPAHTPFSIESKAEAASIHAGWLAVVIRQALQGWAITRPRAGDHEELVDYEGFAEDVANRYGQERWRMLCGCLAGEHPSTMEALQAAHPERRP